MAVVVDSCRGQWEPGQRLFRDHTHRQQHHLASGHRIPPARAGPLCGVTAAILWFTGLSGSGKSTMANGVNGELHRRGVAGYALDGDNVRHGLCHDLGFTDADRMENIRRIGEVAKLFLDAGVITLTTFVSPFQVDRDRARALVPPGDFLEVYCAADLAICEQRDPQGLYAKARAGEIKHFTGLDSPYEPPKALNW